MYLSLANCMKLIREKYPMSDLSLYRLRQIAKSGEIKVLGAGSKVLVLVSSLEKHLEMKLTD